MICLVSVAVSLEYENAKSDGTDGSESLQD